MEKIVMMCNKLRERAKTVTVSPMKDVLSTIELKRLECLRKIAKSAKTPDYRTSYWTASVMKDVEYCEGYSIHGCTICYHKPSGRYFDTECDKKYKFKLWIRFADTRWVNDVIRRIGFVISDSTEKLTESELERFCELADKYLRETENEVNVIKMGTLDKVLTECKLWGCGFNYNEETGNYVLCYKRPNRFKPYLAIYKVNRRKDRQYLPFGGRVTYGEFDVKNVKKGDILFGGLYDKQKCRSVRAEFYLVLSNSKKDGLTIADGSWTTYSEVYNYKHKEKEV